MKFFAYFLVCVFLAVVFYAVISFIRFAFVRIKAKSKAVKLADTETKKDD